MMPKKSIIGERRGIRRFDLEIPSKVRLSDTAQEEIYALATRDVSSAGAFFQTAEPLPTGTEVKVDLILPIKSLRKILEKLGGTYKSIRIEISGRVLRSESSGMAVSFDKDYRIDPWTGEETD